MEKTILDLNGIEVEGYSIPLGDVNLLVAKTNNGLVGCGVIDIDVLDKFNVPAAKVTGVSTIDDVLKAEIKAVNQAATAKGA